MVCYTFISMLITPPSDYDILSAINNQVFPDNGCYGKTTTNRNAFTPAYGQIRLIDNDGDGKFECVISKDAVNIVLKKIVDGIIYGKNTDINGKKYTIDTKNLDLVDFFGEIGCV